MPARERDEGSGAVLALASICGAGAAALGCAERGPRARHGGSAIARLAKADVDTMEKKKRKQRPSDVPDDLDWNRVSNDWEIDCFSRPIIREGKKLWELMVTDKNAIYRRVAQMKPTRVNSVVVQKLMTIFIEESKVKPRSIRFYRKVMKNMLTVALTTIKDVLPNMKELRILPSRNCHMLRLWLAYREREVYPKMEGYNPTAKRRSQAVQASMVQMMYQQIPEKIRFSRYAISAIPLGALARVKPGQLPGNLCRIPPGFSDTALVHGMVILSTRADVVCTLMNSMELAAVRLNTETNELLIDMGIETTYKIEKVPPEDKESVLQFERAKRQMAGLHFVAVHNPLTGGEPNLPIEADDMGPGEGCITGLWLCIDYAPQDDQ